MKQHTQACPGIIRRHDSDLNASHSPGFDDDPTVAERAMLNAETACGGMKTRP